MGRPIATEFAHARKVLTGVLDPSGLKLVFELDGSRVFCHVLANDAICGRARVVPPGSAQAIVDDVAHAAVAALRTRVGVTRESRMRFLKPLYAGEQLRADGTLLREGNDIAVISVRLLNAKEQVCLEAETEIFLLTLDQVRRMTPDGNVPLELHRYLP